MFTILSFKDIDTHPQDIDSGVIRLPQDLLPDAKRGDLVKITTENGKSIVRIVRRGMGSSKLEDNQVAMQYDDRVELGLRRTPEANLTITKISDWLGLYRFFKTHPAPLVRLEARLSWVMLFLGTALGALVGIPLGYLLP